MSATGVFRRLGSVHRSTQLNLWYRFYPQIVLKSRFFFVSLDRGEPPHIHVRRDNKVAKFWLDPVVLQQAGGYSRTELNFVTRSIREHREMFLERWYDFFGDR